LNYRYLNNSGVLQTGSVSITFKTDDGNNASALQVTSLGALPTGWSGPGSLTCASVNNDNTVEVCPVVADGTFGTCPTVTIPSAATLNSVAVH
jgi:hypothetical protein